MQLKLDILPTTKSYLRINPHLQIVRTQVYAETERFPRVYSRRASRARFLNEAALLRSNIRDDENKSRLNCDRPRLNRERCETNFKENKGINDLYARSIAK